jgi:hypothetical protein
MKRDNFLQVLSGRLIETCPDVTELVLRQRKFETRGESRSDYIALRPRLCAFLC